jgi:hypothetical protein
VEPLAARHRLIRVRALRTIGIVLVTLLAGCASSSHVARLRSATSTAVSSPSPGLRVSLTALTCPGRVLHPPPMSLPPSGGATSAFISGEPTSLLACRYHESSLARSARLTSGPIAAALNSAEPIPPGAIYNCPADLGDLILLYFEYPSGARLRVSTWTKACAFASNGERMVFTPRATIRQLEAALA